MTEFEKVLAECFKRVEKSMLTPEGLAIDCADNGVRRILDNKCDYLADRSGYKKKE